MATKEFNLGKISWFPKGVWIEGTYDRFDHVTHEGNSYVSKVNNNTANPTDATKWDKITDDSKLAQLAGDVALKVDKSSVKQTTGTSETDVMSQKAVTDEIAQLAGEVSLLDAVQGAKIKDIENVLSTANLNQSAQVSVSGVSPLSLPKNAANGGMRVKMEGLTAENLVTGGKLIIVTGFAHNTGIKIDIINGNKYYGKRLYQTISGTDGAATGRITTLNPTHEFVRASESSRVSTYSEVTEIQKLLYMYGPQVGTDTISEFSDVMIINLTATFGAGNEPTKEQCDLMFADYFEGVKCFEPTGRVRSVGKNGLNPTHLYLNAPELRSNNMVKDEIRKGANGYELVKRVGVGTLGDEMVPNGGFDTDTGWSNPTGGFTIAGGVATYDGSEVTAHLNTNTATSFVANKWYRISFDIIGGALECGLLTTGSGILFGGDINAVRNPGRYILYRKASATAIGIQFYARDTSIANSALDNFSVKEITGAEAIANTFTELSDGTILYTLATPEIIPISYGGVLNSAENGTVYHEPIIADAGVYETKMDILLTDYPIATIEEIIKYENGIDTYLNVASAVVASDGLSFTHPDLADGDLVLFTYAFDKESTNGNITATFYDSNVVKIDTVTGKAYKIEDVVTDGVLTRILTEV